MVLAEHRCSEKCSSNNNHNNNIDSSCPCQSLSTEINCGAKIGVENKDEIYSCAQLEARQQKSAEEPVALQAAATPAVTVSVKTSDKVLKENVDSNNHTNNKPLLEDPKKPAEEVIKVLGPAASSNIIRKLPVSTSSISRPVSVTASIFNTVNKKASTAASGAGAGDKPPPRKVPQSVTAKLFVTLNQQSTASSTPTVSCNKPKHATEKIFAPRTEDMNKGFLMFSEEEPGLTMLKDEPDDLTHLAPTAGDACIPLEETGPFFNDVFDDFMIPESYTSLLQDELSSLDSSDHHRLGVSSGSSISSIVSSGACPIAINGTSITTASHHHHTTSSSLSSPSSITSSSSSCASSLHSTSSNSCSSSSGGSSGIGTGSSVGTQNSGQNGQIGTSSNDPFINYRDEISEISHSPHLLSPGLSKSPEGSSIPSLCSPNGSACPEDELAFMTLNMDDDLDLSMRAPYISMSEVDDLPLLTSDDLMWGAPPTSIESTVGSTTLTMAATSKYLIKEEFPTQNHHQNHNNHHQQQQQQGHSESTSKSTANARTDAHSHSSNNNENNCNIGNKIIDSSLAALLCGNVINIQTSTIQLQQHQHQQQQQSQNGNSRQILIQPQQHQPVIAPEEQQQQQQRETIAEKKIKLIESNLVHPMVVISPGYKNSNTIETWTMNDLLQLNTSSGGASTTGTSTKLNATVIASIVSRKNSNATAITNTNKRSLTMSESSDGNSKRVKSTTASTISTGSSSQMQQSPTSSPQLLQQLMAPSPVPAKAKAKSKTLLDQSDRWPTGKVNGLQEQASNSVLMNLLVSGCDVSAGYTCFPRPSKAAKA